MEIGLISYIVLLILKVARCAGNASGAFSAGSAEGSCPGKRSSGRNDKGLAVIAVTAIRRRPESVETGSGRRKKDL
jgi:hypothetical protein